MGGGFYRRQGGVNKLICPVGKRLVHFAFVEIKPLQDDQGEVIELLRSAAMFQAGLIDRVANFLRRQMEFVANQFLKILRAEAAAIG